MAELNKTFKVLFRMHGGNTATKVSTPKHVILGNGGFEVGSEPTGDIERRFMSLAEALGYTVIVARRVETTFALVPLLLRFVGRSSPQRPIESYREPRIKHF